MAKGFKQEKISLFQASFLFWMPFFALNAQAGLMELVTNTAIKAGVIFRTEKTQIRHFVDGEEMDLQLGVSSSALLNKKKQVQLLKGSLVAFTNKARTIQTPNATIDFQGTIVVSYDKTKESTSAFVVQGVARISNFHRKNNNKMLYENEGGVMMVEQAKPRVQSNLTLIEVSHWLTRYGWTGVQQGKLLEKINTRIISQRPDFLRARKKPSPRQVQRELANYFPQGKGFYEKRYTSSSLRGKSITSFEQGLLQGRKSPVLSPEEAARIELPSFGVYKQKANKRDLASLKKVKKFIYHKKNRFRKRKLFSALPQKMLKPSAPKKPPVLVTYNPVKDTLDKLNALQEEEKQNRSPSGLKVHRNFFLENL